MLLLYFILASLIHLLALPFLLCLSFKAKYRLSFKKRFFLPTNLKNVHFDYWMHACSVGEVASLSPIIKAIGDKKILLSVITQTGFKEASKRYANSKQDITIIFLPFETLLPFITPKTTKLLVYEAELWPMLFFCAKKKGAKTKLVNARISLKSFGRYKKASFFYKMIFSYIDSVLAQSKDDEKRLKELGAKNIKVIGNIKALSEISPTKTYTKPLKKILCAASTHDGEERLVLESYFELKKEGLLREYMLVLAPRHPERFKEVYNLAKTYSSTKLFSEFPTSILPSFNIKEDILLVDTLGELVNIYNISEGVILGGSFVSVGGHNPLEPATFHVKLISGKEIYNQLELFKLVENALLIDKEELYISFKKLDSIKPSYIKENKKESLNEILS
ncbi:3-deoxy-D-manno-octulosonic acid transferase [Helicobacter sp. 13S00401-1]|uniref:lipid IV(A) 3-deoxy-D-manno-octulosonic acid transferase n=1 Tax=Helicobacter sp. 13S00401-1 TaxID=1905758 RepID=UPI000BA6F2B0|nr:lipid IV(A) 3-deoxy-D-manno-octulosonic acid transferase [Helicobacter sp. 13S00401-1]PAF49678.1 3-deoxy-D-manno-octulosonic acid transferase [Helicobacter sp. 13S00401-1]